MCSWALIGLADSFGVLLVGWLVVVVRGLYPARHLFTLFRFTNEYSWGKKEKKEQMDTVRRTVKVLDRESVNKHDVVTTADIVADSLLLLDMVCQLFCKHYQINLPLPS